MVVFFYVYVNGIWIFWNFFSLLLFIYAKILIEKLVGISMELFCIKYRRNKDLVVKYVFKRSVASLNRVIKISIIKIIGNLNLQVSISIFIYIFIFHNYNILFYCIAI